MPLPPTPLEVAVSNESSEEGTQQSSEKCDRSTMPLPPTSLDSIISNGSMKSSTPLTLSIGAEGDTADDTNIGGMKKALQMMYRQKSIHRLQMVMKELILMSRKNRQHLCHILLVVYQPLLMV